MYKLKLLIMAAKDRDYHTQFDPQEFLKYYNEVSAWLSYPLKALHDLFQSYEAIRDPAGLKVLDFGCGPIPVYQCSATPYASEIVFAEYTEKNREVLQMWIDKDPKSFDFTPFFKYVVQDLEGKGEDEVIKRQDELRKHVKGVIPCDGRSDPPLLLPGYEGPYDIILCSLSLSVASSTEEEFNQVVRKLTKYLKIGGKLLIFDVEGQEGYYVGKELFPALNVTPGLLTSAFKENGYTDVNISRKPHEELNIPGTINPVASIFAIATKK